MTIYPVRVLRGAQLGLRYGAQAGTSV